MSLRLAINGFGRIGRAVFRIVHSRDDMQVVAINDLYDARSLAYLLEYDTVMGRFPGEVSHAADAIVVDGRAIPLSHERTPASLPWRSHRVDIVVESTGVFRRREQIAPHLDAGAARVILTVPPKDDIDAVVVLGVNDDTLGPGDRLVSNASCTTNCLAPLVKILDDAFGVARGLMTTVHAYTNDQRLADVPHRDFRRARAAALNVIPTTTGAAKAVGAVLPHLKGRLDGLAMRVPVPDGSVVDLVVELGADPSVAEINDAVAAAARGPMRRIVEVAEDPLVSSDIIGNPHSCIFDPFSTLRIGPRRARVLAWYDNEWGYSQRVVDLAERLGALASAGVC